MFLVVARAVNSAVLAAAAAAYLHWLTVRGVLQPDPLVLQERDKCVRSSTAEENETVNCAHSTIDSSLLKLLFESKRVEIQYFSSTI